MNDKTKQNPPATGIGTFKGNPMQYRPMPKAVDDAKSRKPVTKND